MLPVTTLCNHTFEYSSIVNWITEQQATTCPLCREEIKLNDLLFNAERIDAIWSNIKFTMRLWTIQNKEIPTAAIEAIQQDLRKIQTEIRNIQNNNLQDLAKKGLTTAEIITISNKINEIHPVFND